MTKINQTVINHQPETLMINQVVVNLDQESQAAVNQASNLLVVNLTHPHLEQLVMRVASVLFAISL